MAAEPLRRAPTRGARTIPGWRSAPRPAGGRRAGDASPLGRQRQDREPPPRAVIALPALQPGGDGQRPAPPPLRCHAPHRLGRHHLRRDPPPHAAQRTGRQPWQARLTAAQRDEFRRWGQRTFQLVSSTSPPPVARARAAAGRGREDGRAVRRRASRAGLSLAEAVEASSTARRCWRRSRSPAPPSGGDLTDLTTAYREATAAIDRVLIALVGSHRERVPGPSVDQVELPAGSIEALTAGIGADHDVLDPAPHWPST